MTAMVRPLRPDVLARPHQARDFASLTRARIKLNMRQLRALIAVARNGTVHRAAEALHLTQPAVTRAVLEFERELGFVLFERTTKGMLLTELGTILFERAVRALGHLESAEHELADVGVMRRSVAGLASKVTHRHLHTVIAVAEHLTETMAAQHLNVSQPSVTQALRDFERIVEAPLFLRTVRGMLATRAGEIVIRRAKLMFVEMAAARDDIGIKLGTVDGHIVVGALPLASTLLVPRAVTLLLKEYPKLRVTMMEGAYDSLLEALRCGDVDLLVGVLRYPAPANDILQERLFEDLLSIVVRKGHPLTAARRLELADVIGAEWVLPYKAAPSRKAFEQVLNAAGLRIPDNVIESNALVTLRGLLMQSDRLSVSSRSQIHYEELHGMLEVLPIDMRGSERPIGITIRADAKRSPGLNALMEHLRTVSIR